MLPLPKLQREQPSVPRSFQQHALHAKLLPVEQVWSLKPNLYASRRCQEMNQRWLFVCCGKIKISCTAFLDGHPVKILKLSYQDMNQKCKTDQTSHIHFFQDLTQTCTQKYNQKWNQLLNFPVHIKNYIWFISGWLLDAYILGFRVFIFKMFFEEQFKFCQCVPSWEVVGGSFDFNHDAFIEAPLPRGPRQSCVKSKFLKLFSSRKQTGNRRETHWRKKSISTVKSQNGYTYT